MNINKKLQEIKKEISELNDKILKVKKGEIKTGLGNERDLGLLSFLESRLKDILIEYNDEFDKTYSEEGMSEGIGTIITMIFAVTIIIFFANFPKHKSTSEEINQSNISAYEEEQKQIYEAKLRRIYD